MRRRAGEAASVLNRGLEATLGPRYLARIMRRSRASRCMAVVMLALFAFQFLVVGSGMACTMPTRAMTGDMGRTASVDTMQGHEASMGVPAATRPRAGEMSHPMPCDQKQSMPICQAMGPCVTALIAPHASAVAEPRDVPSRAIAMVVLTPPSATFPPELPPPRA